MARFQQRYAICHCQSLKNINDGSMRASAREASNIWCLQIYSPEQLTELMASSDYIVAALPSTPATTKLVNAEAINAMQAHAIFINLGRGITVDEEALTAGETYASCSVITRDTFLYNGQLDIGGTSSGSVISQAICSADKVGTGSEAGLFYEAWFEHVYHTAGHTLNAAPLHLSAVSSCCQFTQTWQRICYECY